MCGIFGLVLGEACALGAPEARRAVRSLFKLSESRGREASGLALADATEVQILKRPITASRLLRRPEYRRVEAELAGVLAGRANGAGPGARSRRALLIGHSRLVTDGVRDLHDNNQPVVAGGMAGIHNGIVVNADELWSRYPQLERRFEVDSEIIFELLRHHYQASGSLAAAIATTYGELRGTAAIAAVFSDLDQLLLATNNGSLYTLRGAGGQALVFASEEYFLRRLAAESSLAPHFQGAEIVSRPPRSAALVDLATLEEQTVVFSPAAARANGALRALPLAAPRRVVDLDEGAERLRRSVPDVTPPSVVDEVRRRFPMDTFPLTGLRRCSRCILPETIPFIRFDAEGVCNFCHGYEKLAFRGEDALRELADRHRRRDGRQEVIVAISGGRDSTYGLHYVKNVLGMNPVAYTYDWAMVTDLARRNIARICGQLGVEHILVSADIPTKRRYIRQNVEAWLRRPELGLIPLFMAGDKAYFYNAYKMRRKTGIDLLFLCENMLERDYFKACFAGAPPEMTDENHIGHLSWRGNLKMVAYYGKHYLLNPRFLNSSIPDTAFAWLCYFVIPRDYQNLYRYIPWDEDEVVSTLIDEYDWETATDTEGTWRIGDGTSPFYNFIYYNVAGFTENDNFFSNQIREGTITRERAMDRIASLNRPRFESIQWYCDTIGVDFERAVATIAAIPKLYRSDGS